MKNYENGYFHVYDNGDVEFRSYESIGGGMFFIIVIAVFVTAFSKFANYVLDNPQVLSIAAGIIALIRTLLVDKGSKLFNRTITAVFDAVKLFGICGMLIIFFDWVACSHWLDVIFFSVIGMAIFYFLCQWVGGYFLFLRARGDSTALYAVLCTIVFAIGAFVNINCERYCQGYDYKVFLNEAVITGCNSRRITADNGEITIPSQLRNYRVTAIGKSDGMGVFGSNKIKSVTISEGITTIKSRAFSYNSGIEAINIPSTVTTIEDEAIYKNKNLKYINVSADNKNFIFENGILYSYDKSREIYNISACR